MLDVAHNQHRERRYHASFVIALLAHAAAIGGTGLLLPRVSRATITLQDVAVAMYTALPDPGQLPASPPPPLGSAMSTPEATPTPQRKVVRPAAPKPAEREPVMPVHTAVATPAPEPSAEAPAGEPASEPPSEPPSNAGGVSGGEPGGTAGGTLGGTLGGTAKGIGGGATVLPFGPGMTRPQQIAGAAPSYGREALAARVEGKVLVRCVLTLTGEVKDCQVLKGVPMLTERVLASLQSSRFTPVTYRGQPQAIQYLFTFNFKLP